jgi:hypothetical protein
MKRLYLGFAALAMIASGCLSSPSGKGADMNAQARREALARMRPEVVPEQVNHANAYEISQALEEELERDSRGSLGVATAAVKDSSRSRK